MKLNKKKKREVEEKRGEKEKGEKEQKNRTTTSDERHCSYHRAAAVIFRLVCCRVRDDVREAICFPPCCFPSLSPHLNIGVIILHHSTHPYTSHTCSDTQDVRVREWMSKRATTHHLNLTSSHPSPQFLPPFSSVVLLRLTARLSSLHLIRHAVRSHTADIRPNGLIVPERK